MMAGTAGTGGGDFRCFVYFRCEIFVRRGSGPRLSPLSPPIQNRSHFVAAHRSAGSGEAVLGD